MYAEVDCEAYKKEQCRCSIVNTAIKIDSDSACN